MSTASFDKLAAHVAREYAKAGVPRATARKWGIETAAKVKREKDARSKLRTRRKAHRSRKRTSKK